MSTPKSPYLVALALCSCALLACAKSLTAENSSETHFLASCEDSCGAGLDCVCGVCTETCEIGGSCSHLGEGARCIAADESSCTRERTCDVECENDADCSALGDRTCQAGHCREPRMNMLDAGTDASTGDAAVTLPAPASCDTDGLIALLVEGEHVFCPGMPSPDAGTDDASIPERMPPDPPDESTRACVENAMAEGRAFLVFSTGVGTDSAYGGGYLGFREGGAWRVYDLSYDSFGYAFDGIGSQTHVEPLWWTPCIDFRVNESCEDDCFQCETDRYEACGCGIPYDGNGPIRVRCVERDQPPCEENSCELDGVCYSSIDFYADTSYHCRCNEDGRHCYGDDESPDTLGRRCESDLDCDPGSSCATDFAGSPGVCTRACGPGCPVDVDCVDVPSVSGGTIADTCLRTCDPSAGDCIEDGLGSECSTLEGSTEMYCL